MSDRPLIALVGASGLVGRSAIAAARMRDDFDLVAIARRAIDPPGGARMNLVVAPSDQWGEIFANARPRALICALGTTMKRVGGDRAAFRAVDRDLVVDTARAARAVGVARLVAISSVGADPASRSFYLRVKGEAEGELRKLGFDRLDILRPGLLRGARVDDRRWLEGLAQLASPLVDRLLSGQRREMRSISAHEVARAALDLAAREMGHGTHIHHNSGILAAARRFEERAR